MSEALSSRQEYEQAGQRGPEPLTEHDIHQMAFNLSVHYERARIMRTDAVDILERLDGLRNEWLDQVRDPIEREEILQEAQRTAEKLSEREE